MIRCLLADLLWDPVVPPDQKTLRTLRQRLVTPEDEMRELLERIHGTSHSPKARDIAGTLKARSRTPSPASTRTPTRPSW